MGGPRARGFGEAARNPGTSPTGRYLEDLAATHRQRHVPALQVAPDILGASAWRHLHFNEHLLQGLIPLAPRRPARNHPTALLERGRHTPGASRRQRHRESWAHAPNPHARATPRPPGSGFRSGHRSCAGMSADILARISLFIGYLGRWQGQIWNKWNPEKFTFPGAIGDGWNQRAWNSPPPLWRHRSTFQSSPIWSALARMLLVCRLQLSNASRDWAREGAGREDSHALL